MAEVELCARSWLHCHQDTAVTFPAFLPAADEWAKTVADNPIYAFDPYPVLKEAAGYMTIEGLAPVRMSGLNDAWDSDVIGVLLEGGTLAEGLVKLQVTLEGLAGVAGYEVVNSR